MLSLLQNTRPNLRYGLYPFSVRKRASCAIYPPNCPSLGEQMHAHIKTDYPTTVIRRANELRDTLCNVLSVLSELCGMSCRHSNEKNRHTARTQKNRTHKTTQHLQVFLCVGFFQLSPQCLSWSVMSVIVCRWRMGRALNGRRRFRPRKQSDTRIRGETETTARRNCDAILAFAV